MPCNREQMCQNDQQFTMEIQHRRNTWTVQPKSNYSNNTETEIDVRKNMRILDTRKDQYSVIFKIRSLGFFQAKQTVIIFP